MHSLLDAILKDDFKSFREIFNTKLEEAIEAEKAGVRAESVSALGFALSESKCKKEEDGECDKEPKEAEPTNDKDEADDEKVIAEKGKAGSKVKKEETEPEKCDDEDGEKGVKVECDKKVKKEEAEPEKSDEKKDEKEKDKDAEKEVKAECKGKKVVKEDDDEDCPCKDKDEDDDDDDDEDSDEDDLDESKKSKKSK